MNRPIRKNSSSLRRTGLPRNILSENTRTQSGAACDAGIRTIVCDQQRDLRRPGIDTPAWQSIFNLAEKGLEHGGDPAANYDHIRIEQVDDVA